MLLKLCVIRPRVLGHLMLRRRFRYDGVLEEGLASLCLVGGIDSCSSGTLIIGRYPVPHGLLGSITCLLEWQAPGQSNVQSS